MGYTETFGDSSGALFYVTKGLYAECGHGKFTALKRSHCLVECELEGMLVDTNTSSAQPNVRKQGDLATSGIISVHRFFPPANVAVILH